MQTWCGSTPQTFNHALTDFALEGAHRKASCARLPQAGRQKHRDAPNTCIGCHARRDVHRKALGRGLRHCHNVASWKETKFDHARATDRRYPLTGAHDKVGCGLCHAGQRYKDTPTTCVACHRIDDDTRVSAVRTARTATQTAGVEGTDFRPR